LCFTLPQNLSQQVEQWIKSGQLSATMVGQIVVAKHDKQVILVDGKPANTTTRGYDHFSS